MTVSDRYLVADWAGLEAALEGLDELVGIRKRLVSAGRLTQDTAISLDQAIGVENDYSILYLQPALQPNHHYRVAVEGIATQIGERVKGVFKFILGAISKLLTLLVAFKVVSWANRFKGKSVPLKQVIAKSDGAHLVKFAQHVAGNVKTASAFFDNLSKLVELEERSLKDIASRQEWDDYAGFIHGSWEQFVNELPAGLKDLVVSRNTADAIKLIQDYDIHEKMRELTKALTEREAAAGKSLAEVNRLFGELVKAYWDFELRIQDPEARREYIAVGNRWSQWLQRWPDYRPEWEAKVGVIESAYNEAVKSHQAICKAEIDLELNQITPNPFKADSVVSAPPLSTNGISRDIFTKMARLVDQSSHLIEACQGVWRKQQIVEQELENSLRTAESDLKGLDALLDQADSARQADGAMNNGSYDKIIDGILPMRDVFAQRLKVTSSYTEAIRRYNGELAQYNLVYKNYGSLLKRLTSRQHRSVFQGRFDGSLKMMEEFMETLEQLDHSIANI